MRSPGWRARRVEVFDTDAGKVLAKGQRPARHPARYQLLNALARLVGVPFLKAVPMHGGAEAQRIELARLQALHEAGAGVPRVLHVACSGAGALGSPKRTASSLNLATTCRTCATSPCGLSVVMLSACAPVAISVLANQHKVCRTGRGVRGANAGKDMGNRTAGADGQRWA